MAMPLGPSVLHLDFINELPSTPPPNTRKFPEWTSGICRYNGLIKVSSLLPACAILCLDLRVSFTKDDGYWPPELRDRRALTVRLGRDQDTRAGLSCPRREEERSALIQRNRQEARKSWKAMANSWRLTHVICSRYCVCRGAAVAEE
jgi:hypothetical protein